MLEYLHIGVAEFILRVIVIEAVAPHAVIQLACVTAIIAYVLRSEYAFVNVVFFIWCDYLTFLIVSFSEVIMRSMP